MLDIKIPDPQTSPFLISVNGFSGRKAPCFSLRPSVRHPCKVCWGPGQLDDNWLIRLTVVDTETKALQMQRFSHTVMHNVHWLKHFPSSTINIWHGHFLTEDLPKSSRLSSMCPSLMWPSHFRKDRFRIRINDSEIWQWKKSTKYSYAEIPLSVLKFFDPSETLDVGRLHWLQTLSFLKHLFHKRLDLRKWNRKWRSPRVSAFVFKRTDCWALRSKR